MANHHPRRATLSLGAETFPEEVFWPVASRHITVDISLSPPSGLTPSCVDSSPLRRIHPYSFEPTKSTLRSHSLSLLVPLHLPEPAQGLELPVPEFDARAANDARVERERLPHGLLGARRGVEPHREVVPVVMAQLVPRYCAREREYAPVSDRADHTTLPEDELAGSQDDSAEGERSVWLVMCCVFLQRFRRFFAWKETRQCRGSQVERLRGQRRFDRAE